jgi:hypothetical protein
VAGDDITRYRPGAKYFWLICNKERNKFISCNERDVGDSSIPFVMMLKSNIKFG